MNSVCVLYVCFSCGSCVPPKARPAGLYSCHSCQSRARAAPSDSATPPTHPVPTPPHFTIWTADSGSHGNRDNMMTVYMSSPLPCYLRPSLAHSFDWTFDGLVLIDSVSRSRVENNVLLSAKSYFSLFFSDFVIVWQEILLHLLWQIRNWVCLVFYLSKSSSTTVGKQRNSIFFWGKHQRQQRSDLTRAATLSQSVI